MAKGWISSCLSCLDQGTCAEGFAPDPLDLYSANRAVFSRAGSRQLPQPSSLVVLPAAVSKQRVLPAQKNPGRPGPDCQRRPKSNRKNNQRVKRSENELHTHLDVTRIVSLRSDDSKGSGVARVETNSVAKVGMVEGVYCFGTKLQFCGLAEVEVFRDR